MIELLLIFGNGSREVVSAIAHLRGSVLVYVEERGHLDQWLVVAMNAGSQQDVKVKFDE